jgi:hypothetical protein
LKPPTKNNVAISSCFLAIDMKESLSLVVVLKYVFTFLSSRYDDANLQKMWDEWTPHLVLKTTNLVSNNIVQ